MPRTICRFPVLRPGGLGLEYKIHADEPLDAGADEDEPAVVPSAGEPRSPAVPGNTGLIEDSRVKDENSVFRVVNVTNVTSETAIRAKLGPELKKLSLRNGDLGAIGPFTTAASTSLKGMDPVAKARVMRKIARSFLEEKGAAVLGTNSKVEYRVLQTVVDDPGGSAVAYQRSVRGVPCPNCGVTVSIDLEGRVPNFSGAVMSLDEILSQLNQKLIDDNTAQERVRAALSDRDRTGLPLPGDVRDDAAIERASILICANTSPYVMRVVNTSAGTFYLDAVTGEIRGGP